jgi:predicted MPP superfamily phosphohydrolase
LSTFVLIIFSIITVLQLTSFLVFRSYLKRKGLLNKFFWKFISIFPFVFFNLPYLYLIFYRNNFSLLPGWVFDSYILPFYVFQGAIIFIGLYLLILKVIKAPFSLSLFLLKKIGSFRNWYNKITSKKQIIKYNAGRRKFITGTTMAVSGYAFFASGMGVIKRNKYEVTKVDIAISNLPNEMKGTTFILASDFHSGPYMSEEMMKEYTDVINSLQGDYIILPGDFTNSNTKEVVPFTKAFRDLKAKKGIYGTLGNHDYFSDPNYIAEYIFNETPIKLLRNSAEILNINGKPLCLLGMEDTRESGVRFTNELQVYMDKTLLTAQNITAEKGLEYGSIPKIMMYHKPYFMDKMSDAKMDLVLSGHTHGGQVVLLDAMGVNLSLASTVSPFISGFYKHKNSQLYVSRGIGMVGLPMRLNCPPEITKITLV